MQSVPPSVRFQKAVLPVAQHPLRENATLQRIEADAYADEGSTGSFGNR